MENTLYRQNQVEYTKFWLGFSLINETLWKSFSYLDIYFTQYCLKSIVTFPVAKLQTLHFVSFINIISRYTCILVTNWSKTKDIFFHNV